MIKACKSVASDPKVVNHLHTRRSCGTCVSGLSGHASLSRSCGGCCHAIGGCGCRSVASGGNGIVNKDG